MFEEIHVANGRVVEGKLDTYKVLRQTDLVLPLAIDTNFEGMSMHSRFSETGEPPLGPPPPALAHAVFKLTGTWMRSQPFSKFSL